MICFDTNIDQIVVDFFRSNIKALSNFQDTNVLIKRVCGINSFFQTENETKELLEKINDNLSIVSEPDRREYGDFQTNDDLALQVAKYAYSKDSNVEFVLEPTCGKGNFLIATLKQFSSLKKIVGVEIYQPYVWETKFKILSHFISNPNDKIPEIDIFHANAFDFPYEALSSSTKELKTLVIGNPPWVTNSELGSIDSGNLPKKSNFKKHSGFEAITGKGNFDIGEYISLIMLDCFQNHNGIFAFLIKNSVIKNIIQDQKRNLYKIADIEKLNIDSKKEFNVSVNASLFISKLNCTSEMVCNEYDFYNKNQITSFGWYKEKFVFSINDYDKSGVIDGISNFIWRSGIKHDCSKIMEFEAINGHYINGQKEDVVIENGLVYGLLKSSDLKDDETNSFRKQTIITQKKIGQDTSYIKAEFPLTYNYLIDKKEFFDKRKSSIYKDKPAFSIFGVGEYSFAPYKVAISGLYKSTHFTLVLPNNEKPIMLDDTCYFIGFDNLKHAQIAHFLVNSEIVQLFLKSIIFSDSKRSVNKDTLMRIDFKSAYDYNSFNEAKDKINTLTINEWDTFGKLLIKNKKVIQKTLF
jgi:hypothetical protein